MGAQSADGVLVLDKPSGVTSFDLVRRVRRAAGQKKIGHTGTLDPMATGVMVLCLGRATKLAAFFEAGEKEYLARILLGLTTDSDDVTGRVTAKRSGFDLSPAEVIRIASEFVGEIEQVPPAYSAVKIDGRRAYDLARRGQAVRLKSRNVRVFDLAVTRFEPPRVTIRARVSKGTYLRSLAADIGRRLGVGACLDQLRRLAVGPFDLQQAVSLDQAEQLAADGRLMERLLPPEEALSFMPGLVVSPQVADMVACGRPLAPKALGAQNLKPGPVRLQAPGGGLMAVYDYQPDRELKPVRVLTPKH
jgi:tRNA pseudouridine55 synthase